MCGGLALASSCTGLSFVSQAARGQLSLAGGDAISEVIAAKKTPPATRAFLKEVVRAKAYSAKQGLNVSENYARFVQLDRDYVVWFVNASDKLSFTPKTFWFPIVGSFPGLAWFNKADAKAFAEDLKADELDVNIRGVTAFSTGGWFTDPVVSSMFHDHPAAHGFLVNTLIHESVHATVLINDQQYFNESLAAFVGNTAAPEYIRHYYGASSTLMKEYELAVQRGKKRASSMISAYLKLNNVYLGWASDEEKLKRKAQLLEALQAELELEFTPNNATLVGFHLYQTGKYEFGELYQACNKNWPRFMQAVASLQSAHFDGEQTANVGPPVLKLARRKCQPFQSGPVRRSLSKQARQRTQREAAIKKQ